MIAVGAMTFIALLIVIAIVLGAFATHSYVTNRAERLGRWSPSQKSEHDETGSSLKVRVVRSTPRGRILEIIEVGSVSAGDPDWSQVRMRLMGEAQQRATELNMTLDETSKEER